MRRSTGPKASIRSGTANTRSPSAVGLVLHGRAQVDVRSNHIETCSKTPLAECPKAAHGRTIFGSDRGDDLRGTRGFDEGSSSGAGDDVIDLHKGGKDRADCGGGDDVVGQGRRPRRPDRRRLRAGPEELRQCGPWSWPADTDSACRCARRLRPRSRILVRGHRGPHRDPRLPGPPRWSRPRSRT